MNLTVALFGVISAIVVVSAVGVAVSRSVVRAAVWLLFTLVALAVMYVLLGAEFLGATQLMVYVGGTLVLMVFGVMITNEGPFAVLATKRWEWIVGSVLALAMFGLLTAVSLNWAKPVTTESESAEPLTSVQELGEGFLGAYLLPFEIVSVHLLVVLIAAAYLARAKKRITTTAART